MEIADRFLIIEKGEFVYEERKATVDTAKIHAYPDGLTDVRLTSLTSVRSDRGVRARVARRRNRR